MHVCIQRCEHAVFCVDIFMSHVYNFTHSFMPMAMMPVILYLLYAYNAVIVLRDRSLWPLPFETFSINIIITLIL